MPEAARPRRRTARRRPRPTATTPSASAAQRWSEPARSSPRTSTRCSNASAPISTYVGEGVAIPHGTLDGKDVVRHDAVSFVRFPGGVDWGGQQVVLCIGIAARGDGHVRLLSELAQILLDPDQARALRESTDIDEVVRLLQPAGEEEPA